MPDSAWAMIRNWPSGILTTAGLLTGTGAVFSASCCVLPLVLGGLGAGASVFAVLEAIADYRKSLLIASTVLVGIAWCVYLGRRGVISTVIALSVATVFVGTAAAWDYLERPLLKAIRTAR
jgi:mercuric ion transport protein